MGLYLGRDCLEAFDLLPLELVDWVVEGLPCYSSLGERVKMERYRGRVTFKIPGRFAKDRLQIARHIEFHRFKRDELRAFLEKKHPEMLEYLASKYPPQDPAVTTPTTEPGHDQQVGIPQLDPPESLPGTPKEYNDQLEQRGFGPAARMYMIRNAPHNGEWGRMTNYAAAAIALGKSIPWRDQAEKDKLNSSYTEHVHYGLSGKPRPKKASKKD